jgi:hypothetical protein
MLATKIKSMNDSNQSGRSLSFLEAIIRKLTIRISCSVELENASDKIDSMNGRNLSGRSLSFLEGIIRKLTFKISWPANIENACDIS